MGRTTFARANSVDGADRRPTKLRFGASWSRDTFYFPCCTRNLRRLVSARMTLTEKVLARAAGKARVAASDNIWVKADLLMTHDVCGPGTIGVFKREFGKNAKVWDRTKVVIIPDHYIFT